MRRLLIYWLFKLLFRGDFNDPIDERVRAQRFWRIGEDEKMMELFQSLYTRAYQSLVIELARKPSDYETGVYIGRLIELQHILDMAEGAEERLRNIEEQEQRINKLKELSGNVGAVIGKAKKFVRKPI